MSKRDSYISHTLKRGDSVYVYYWEDDIIVRFQNIEGKLKAFVTNRDGKVLEKDWASNEYMQNALEMGELMTKEEFDNFSYDVGDQHFTTIEKQLEAGEYLWNNKNVNASISKRVNRVIPMNSVCERCKPRLTKPATIAFCLSRRHLHLARVAP